MKSQLFYHIFSNYTYYKTSIPILEDEDAQFDRGLLCPLICLFY